MAGQWAPTVSMQPSPSRIKHCVDVIFIQFSEKLTEVVRVLLGTTRSYILSKLQCEMNEIVIGYELSQDIYVITNP